MSGYLALSPGRKCQNWVDFRIPSRCWKIDVWSRVCSALSIEEKIFAFLVTQGFFSLHVGFQRGLHLWRLTEFSQISLLWNETPCVVLSVFTTVELTRGLCGNDLEVQTLWQWPAQSQSVLFALCYVILVIISVRISGISKILSYGPFLKILCSSTNKKPWVKQLVTFS